MEFKNNTRVCFDYKLKCLIQKLHVEHKDLINSLKNDEYIMMQDTQKSIREYFVKHQSELNIAGILKNHYQSCPDFFALLCAVVADLNKCENWNDVWYQLTQSNKENQTLYDSSNSELFEYINYDTDLNVKIDIFCLCSHRCRPENMSIITNGYTNLKLLIACDCLEKTGIISSYEFKKKSKMNDCYAKIMYNKLISKLNKKSIESKWSDIVEKYNNKISNYRYCVSCRILSIKKTDDIYIKICKSCYVNQKSQFKTGICYLKR